MGNRAQSLETDDGQTVVLAFEEAIGYMCGSRVLDKDGVFAAVRMAELIAFLELQEKTLTSKLQELYKQYAKYIVTICACLITCTYIPLQIRLSLYQLILPYHSRPECDCPALQ